MAVAEHPVLSDSGELISRNPATGAIVGTHPIHGPADVEAAVERAKSAAAWWRALGSEGRKQRLLAFKGVIARRSAELCDLVQAESGKTRDDAFLEIVLCVDHLDWAARNAGRIMRPRRVRSTLLMADQAAYLEYLPVGVVGVIGPWNYPVHTPMGSISYALAAGNAVIFKPSEHTPGVGAWLVRAFGNAVERPAVLQLLTGAGETGGALCAHAGIDVLAFTGSPATGRKVMQACATNLTKVVMECGGNDAMIVDGDADLDAAAEAALWGGCANAGQTCAGVERVFVVADAYEPFVDKLVARARRIHAGDGGGADYGPMTVAAQVEIVRRHLDDALARGAKALVGGPESIRAADSGSAYIDPVILVDVPEDAALQREETFGPMLPINRVADIDEAVARANASDYGLGATVYSGSRGMEIARRLETGMVSVNAVLRYAGIPGLPFGGRGESGFGRIHGEDGLKEFTATRAITRPRMRVPVEFASFDRPPWLFKAIDRMQKTLHGRRR